MGIYVWEFWAYKVTTKNWVTNTSPLQKKIPLTADIFAKRKREKKIVFVQRYMNV